MSNSQRTALAIRELIFSGELSPGSDHLETELAVRLGVSRTPVREAVLVLESQGLLEVRPRKGVRILPVSADDMREIYDILTVLESLAAQHAAEVGYSEDDLSDLTAAIADMESAIRNDERRLWAEADERFHKELVRLGGNKRVMEIFDRMSDQVRRAKAVTLFLRPLPVQSNEDHRRVCEAIRAGQPEVARATHRRHRKQAKDILIGILKKMGLNSL